MLRLNGCLLVQQTLSSRYIHRLVSAIDIPLSFSSFTLLDSLIYCRGGGSIAKKPFFVFHTKFKPFLSIIAALCEVIKDKRSNCVVSVYSYVYKFGRFNCDFFLIMSELITF